MAPSKEVIRNLLLFEYELGKDAKTAAANINRAKGQGTIGESTARKWFQRFREEGTENLADKGRSGRPREVDREAIVEAIDEDPSLSTEDLAIDFDCTQQQVQNILKAAGKNGRRVVGSISE